MKHKQTHEIKPLRKERKTYEVAKEAKRLREKWRRKRVTEQRQR